MPVLPICTLELAAYLANDRYLKRWLKVLLKECYLSGQTGSYKMSKVAEGKEAITGQTGLCQKNKGVNQWSTQWPEMG